jgi:hypothetical protein
MIEILDGNRLVKLKYGFDSYLSAIESMMGKVLQNNFETQYEISNLQRWFT